MPPSSKPETLLPAVFVKRAAGLGSGAGAMVSVEEDVMRRGWSVRFARTGAMNWAARSEAPCARFPDRRVAEFAHLRLPALR